MSRMPQSNARAHARQLCTPSAPPILTPQRRLIQVCSADPPANVHTPSRQTDAVSVRAPAGPRDASPHEFGQLCARRACIHRDLAGPRAATYRFARPSNSRGAAAGRYHVYTNYRPNPIRIFLFVCCSTDPLAVYVCVCARACSTVAALIESGKPAQRCPTQSGSTDPLGVNTQSHGRSMLCIHQPPVRVCARTPDLSDTCRPGRQSTPWRRCSQAWSMSRIHRSCICAHALSLSGSAAQSNPIQPGPVFFCFVFFDRSIDRPTRCAEPWQIDDMYTPATSTATRQSQALLSLSATAGPIESGHHDAPNPI